jgi:hypothetical protein
MGLPDFKALKEKVGIDDIAYSLGYRVNRLAGVGKFVEMCLTDGNGKHIDTIVIRNPKDKAGQSFFRHNAMGKGDVINFIKENIDSFHEQGRNQWEKIANILRKFANEPIPDIGDSAYLKKMGYTESQHFDASRYEVQPMAEHLKNGMMYMTPRGFSKETLKTFSPFIVRIKDLKSDRFNDYNIGFPYREPGKDEILGYEIRGYGNFKGKVTGTNSTTAAWIASLSREENPMAVRNVYFAESAYDIMAFYQANAMRIDRETSVFVSIGGTFSDRQVTGIMRHYENANAVDCFDNDLAGRIYGIRMAGLLSGKHLNIVKCDDAVRITLDGKEVAFKEAETNLQEVSRHMGFSSRMRQWKPPKAFKDWNDVIMNKPFVQLTQKDKFERDAALEKRRSSGLKA